MQGIIVGNNDDIDRLKPENASLHPNYDLLSSGADLFGEESFTFESNPGFTNDGDQETMITIPFDLGYTPMVYLLLEDDSNGKYTILTELQYWSCWDPGSDFFDETQHYYWIKGHVDDERIRVYLEYEKIVSGAGGSGSCTLYDPTGDSFNFKYYIFHQGMTDDDVQEVSVNI